MLVSYVFMKHFPIDVAEISSVLDYCSESGKLYWKIPRGRGIKAGDIAGGVYSHGHIVVKYKGRRYQAHRLAWALFYKEDPGSFQIDHINRNGADNRIKNLRLATPAINSLNIDRAIYSRKSGCVGVYFTKAGVPYSTISFKGKVVYLGCFNSVEEAAKARDKAAVVRDEKAMLELKRLLSPRGGNGRRCELKIH